VSARYSAAFAFAGALYDITIQLPDGRDVSSDAAAKSEWSRQ